MPDSQLAQAALKADRLGDDLLGFMLAHGRRIDLERLPNADGLGVRAALWEAAFESTCHPVIHVVCGHRYVLVAEGDGEGLGPYAFDLGALGQVSPVRWLPRSDSANYWVATLVVDVVNYPEGVFRSTPTAVRVQRRYHITVDAIQGQASVALVR